MLSAQPSPTAVVFAKEDGTTLLYSLEEAKDDGNDNGAMMTEVGAAAATTVAASMESAAEGASAASPDPTNPWAHLSEPASATGSAAAAAVPETNNNNANDNANAEDIQIAWENLEAARTIVEKMLLQQATTMTMTTSSSSGMSETEVAKLQLWVSYVMLVSVRKNGIRIRIGCFVLFCLPFITNEHFTNEHSLS